MNGVNLQKKLVCLLSFLLLGGLSIQCVSQNRNVKAGRKAQGTGMALSSLYKAMLPATAKVMFVDSVVVSKADFLRYVPLNKESGSITAVKGKHGSDGLPFAQYENELGDRRFFVDGDSATTRLYSQTLLGNGWDNPLPLDGINFHDYASARFPFVSSDGVTLFFAAKGAQSVGGYDIFMTTYDNDKAQWYEPQNYGLPFNSPANEYLLAIDDLDTLGWLVSDRHQPADSVCIYTFVPTSPRKDFQDDNLDDKHLARYANIAAIRETWKFGNRKAALARLAAMMARNKTRRAGNHMSFAINDRKIVTSVSQFKKSESGKLYAQLQELDSLTAQTKRSLNALRLKYAQQPSARKALSAEIMKLEKEQLRQEMDAKELGKKIRNLENK